MIRRDDEIADVLQLILENQARLVTLTGTGGYAKTRSAQQVGAEAAGAFPLRLVELASLDDPFPVPQVLATIVM